jgi:hypothetical protein
LNHLFNKYILLNKLYSISKAFGRISNSYYLAQVYLILYSAERACAVRLSPRANTDAILPNVSAPLAEQFIKLERF